MSVTRRTATGLLLAGAAVRALPAIAATPTIKVPTRGFALPDWLAAEPREPSTTVLAQLRNAGFETIRLPLNPELVSDDFLPRVDAALAATTSAGFNAILDLHPQGEIIPGAIVDVWTRLAPLIARTSPATVFPELLNEPSLDSATWRGLRDTLAGILRAAAPHHTLIWGPARVQGIWELDATGPLHDPNSIVAVHYYFPMGFTHQCENWDDSPLARIKNLPFPATRKAPEVTALAATLSTADRAFLDGEFESDWSAAHVQEDFMTLGRWARRHHTSTMLGEFGVLNFCVGTTGRATWVRTVRQAAEANGAGWSYWEADQGFGFLADRIKGGLDQQMVEALLA
jgi:endoglucanase